MKTVKVKTAELEGAALDYAVSKAVNDSLVYVHDGCVIYDEFIEQHGDVFPVDYSPSTDWSQGGVLIDAYTPLFNFCNAQVRAEVLGGVGMGDTYLIAACRAIVASRIGEEVELPEELLK